MTVHMTQRQRRRKLWKRGTQKPTPKKENDFLAGIAFKFQGMAVLRAQAEHGKPQPPPPDRQSRVFYYGVAKGHEEDIQHCRRQAGPLVIVGTSRAPLSPTSLLRPSAQESNQSSEKKEITERDGSSKYLPLPNHPPLCKVCELGVCRGIAVAPFFVWS